MTIAALLAGCWSAHTNLLERDDSGALILRCQECRHVTRLNESEVIKYPKPQQVLGQPTGKARRENTGERGLLH